MYVTFLRNLMKRDIRKYYDSTVNTVRKYAILYEYFGFERLYATVRVNINVIHHWAKMENTLYGGEKFAEQKICLYPK